MLRRPAASLALLLAVQCMGAVLVPHSLAEQVGPAVQARGAWGVDSLLLQFAQRREVRAQFVEVKHLRLLARPLVVSGTLLYQAPDLLEKRATTPNVEILRVEGDWVTVEIPARRIRRSLSLQDNPVLWVFVESLRATLAGDAATLARFHRITMHGDARAWRLELAPIEPAMRAVIASIDISGRGHTIREIEVRESRGDRSVMTILEGGG